MTRTPANTDKASLSADCWAAAALDAIAYRGIEGIAVEPLARRLGVTKGSFYWHFANREALLTRALELWEQQETDDVLQRAAQETDPHRRIGRLIREINASKRASRIYQALSSASRDPLIAAFVHRVSERRMRFLVECYQALGLSTHDARLWARMTYSVYLGTLQIRHDLPEEWPSADAPDFADYVEFLMQKLVPQTNSADEAVAPQEETAATPGAVNRKAANAAGKS